MEKTARDRLLDAADELFYAEGIHTVGIDRVIERAGVAKASLYANFKSKEELVRAYLEGRGRARRAHIEGHVARHEDPRDKILSVFDSLAERAREPSFRGCAFANATAEGIPDEGCARALALDMRSWLRNLLTSLAGELGVADASHLGRCLQVLYDGAMMAASIERDLRVVDEARALAEALLDEHAPPRRASRKAPRKSAR